MKLPITFIIAARNVLHIRNEIITGFIEYAKNSNFSDNQNEFRDFADALLKFANYCKIKPIFEQQFIFKGKRVVKTDPYPNNIKEFPLCDLDNAYENAMSIIDKSELLNIKIVGFQDLEYPQRLRSIGERPAVLYAKGDFSIIDNTQSVAVIGTRNPTPRAKEIAVRIGGFLGKNGINVVSGLALGCDCIAQEASLNSGGITTAILSNGLDNKSIYPKKNLKLAERIANEGGLLLSEYAVGQKCSPHSLVQRDKWQAQLSSLVIPVQTSETGGTMHAVNWAFQHQIPIAAVNFEEYKTKIDDNSIGYMNLIKNFSAYEMATLTNLKDILIETRIA